MANIDLPDELYNEILRLANLYRREADKCRVGKAYLAGCIMMGAALEAILLAFANCFPEEAAESVVAPRRKDSSVRPLLDWSFAQLLGVAKDRNWLPSGLSLDEDWNNASAKVGDYSEVVRQIRNLVHPVRYANDFPRKRITKRYLESSFEIVDVATDYLMNKLTASLRALIEEKERRIAKKASRKKKSYT